MTRVGWQTARIIGVEPRTPTIKSFFLRLPAPIDFVAGQHVDLRLSAPDGYVAIRSYSIASAPAGSDVIELAIERLVGGEVSEFLHDIAMEGDEIELKGPLGGHFVWPQNARAILTIGGGSGIVPLLSMVRYRSSLSSPVPMALLLSARSMADALYLPELRSLDKGSAGFDFFLALTREAPLDVSDYGRRVDSPMIAEILSKIGWMPDKVFVCGSNSFVEVAVKGLIEAGVPSPAILTERYGT